MAGQAGAVELHVQSADLQKLFVELKAMQGSLQVELRRGIREAAIPAVRAVQASASWSSRIPGAVKAQPFFTAKRAGARIVVDAKQAPEAAPLDNHGQSGPFRHMVFGNRNNWVDQPARPFFEGKIERSVEVEMAMRSVMTRVAAKGGL
jgi:hypothetical protein